MKVPPAVRYSYKVGPWRRAFPWLLVGPFLPVGLACVIWGTTEEDRAVGWLLCGVLGVMGLGIHALIAYARLELTTDGLRLRQFGMNMSVPWSNVAGLRLQRRCEGFVTRRPITGSGAANFAAVGGMGVGGTPLYNQEQQAAIAERRWVPIEAFAWHLRRGTLRETLAKLAPAVQPLPSLIETPEATPASAPPERGRLIALICGIVALIGISVWVGLQPPPWRDRVSAVLFAVVAPLATWRTSLGARRAFRTGARLVGVLFAFMTVFGVLWCLIAWDEVAKAFR